MIEKKKLYKKMGSDNDFQNRCLRTLTSPSAVMRNEEVMHRQTWQEKRKPKSSWYKDTPDIHVYGGKK